VSSVEQCGSQIGHVTRLRAEIQYANRVPSGEMRGALGPAITVRLPLCATSEPIPGTGSPILVPSGRMRTKWSPSLARIVPSSACEGQL
jgi:hypothetical protein